MESTKKTVLRFVVLLTLSTVSSGCLAMSLRTKGPPDDALVQRLVFELEPVDVVVGGSHDAGQPSPLHTAFGFDGWMHGFETEVVDHTGEVVQDGAMGTLGGVFLTDNPWPPVDRDDDVFRWDVARERVPAPMAHGDMASTDIHETHGPKTSQASAQAVNCSVASTR